MLGNKIDLGRAASEEDLRYTLGLYETYGKEVSLRRQITDRHSFDVFVSVHALLTRSCRQLLMPISVKETYNHSHVLHHCCLLMQAKNGKTDGVRPIELYMCSVVRKMGYGDG